MNKLAVPTFAAFFAVAAMATSALAAAEPVKSIEDLSAIESKVVAVANRVLPSTVALISAKSGGSGSGVIVSKDGLIYTAAHVVQGEKSMMVVFPDGKQFTGKVLGANFSKDIAMVKIEEAGQWPAVEPGKSRPLEAGDFVVALGHSAGFDPARTPPVRFGRVVSKGPGNYFTTDCTLIGGDSGGPIFDLAGNLIGVNSSIGQSNKNNNHAGIDGFRDDGEALLAGKNWGELTMDPLENPDMPVLGARLVQNASEVRLQMVPVYTPAGRAGLKAGDAIQAVDNQLVADPEALSRLLAKYQPGDTVKVNVRRDNKALEFNVKLARRGDLYR